MCSPLRVDCVGFEREQSVKHVYKVYEQTSNIED